MKQLIGWRLVMDKTIKCLHCGEILSITTDSLINNDLNGYAFKCSNCLYVMGIENNTVKDINDILLQ